MPDDPIKIDPSFERMLDRSRGRPLPGEARDFAEQHLGRFPEVRVHSDPTAQKAAGAMGAQAFTVGSDVYFGSDPGSFGRPSDRALLVHEISHVLQGTGDARRAPLRPGGVADRAETLARLAETSFLRSDGEKEVLFRRIRHDIDAPADLQPRVRSILEDGAERARTLLESDPAVPRFGEIDHLAVDVPDLTDVSADAGARLTAAAIVEAVREEVSRRGPSAPGRSAYALRKAVTEFETAEAMALHRELTRERFTRALRTMAAGQRDDDPELAAHLEGGVEKLDDEWMLEKVAALGGDKPKPSEAREWFGELLDMDPDEVPLHRDSWKPFEQSGYIFDMPAGVIPDKGPYDPPSHSGWYSEVAKVDVSAEHAMEDELPTYIQNRLTNAVVRRAIEKQATIELHMGSDEETFASLRNRGFRIVGRVESSQGNYERVFLAVHETSGEPVYAVTGLEGYDRVRHMQLLLKFASPDGKRLKPDQVEVYGDRDFIRRKNVERFGTALKHHGLKGGEVLIGSRVRFRKELSRRAEAAQQVKALREAYGKTPGRALRTALKTEAAGTGDDADRVASLLERLEGRGTFEVLDQDPKVFYRSGRKTDALELEISYLKRKRKQSEILSALFGDGGGLGKKSDADWYEKHDAMGFTFEEYVIRTSKGLQPLKVLTNVYGDRMEDLATAVVDAGYRRLMYAGTAGGVGEGSEVGDVHIPGEIHDTENELANPEVRNALLEHVEALAADEAIGDSVRSGTRIANVFSPAVETKDWLDAEKELGTGAVEVELSFLARAAENARQRGKDVDLYGALVLSDVVGTEESIADPDPAKQEAGFQAIVDRYMEVLDVQEIVPRRDAGEVITTDVGHDLALVVAEQLIGRKADAGKLTLLRDEIAQMILDGLGGKDPVEALGPFADEDATVEALPVPEDRKEAIAKRAATRLRDPDVVKAIAEANGELANLAISVGAHTDEDWQLGITGAFAAGRWMPDQGRVEVVLVSEDPVAEAVVEEWDGQRIDPRVVSSLPGNALDLGQGERLRLEPNGLLFLYQKTLVEKRNLELYFHYTGSVLTSYLETRTPEEAADF